MTKFHNPKIARSRTKFHQVQELGGSQQLQELTGKVEVVKSTIDGINSKIGDSEDSEGGNSLFSRIRGLRIVDQLRIASSSVEPGAKVVEKDLKKFFISDTVTLRNYYLTQKPGKDIGQQLVELNTDLIGFRDKQLPAIRERLKIVPDTDDIGGLFDELCSEIKVSKKADEVQLNTIRTARLQRIDELSDLINKKISDDSTS